MFKCRAEQPQPEMRECPAESSKISECPYSIREVIDGGLYSSHISEFMEEIIQLLSNGTVADIPEMWDLSSCRFSYKTESETLTGG